MNMKLSSLLTILIFIVSCSPNDNAKKNPPISRANTVQPPIINADIPFKEYSVDAEKGDTLFYNTGSIILFPPNSFVDKNGNVIKGNVKVKYREFTSPIDFYLSGIPMSYDSSGKQFTLESFGMCEIIAYKDSLPLFVNPACKPEINIATQNNSSDQLLYYFDTTQKKWVNKGICIKTDLNNKTKITDTEGSSLLTEMTEPPKPVKANNKSPVIKIIIDPASFKELLVYDNLRFQLDPNAKNFNPKDTAEDWKNIELIKGNSKGLYTLKFSSQNRSVLYSAKPVFVGKDYDKALKIFDKTNKGYQKKLNNRLKNEKAIKKQYSKDSIAYSILLDENKRIERLNSLIEIRNKEIEEQNEITQKINKQIIDNNQATKLFRSFQFDLFGIWNCDRAVALNCIPIAATFKDNKGNSLELTNVAVLYKSFNGILTFNDNYNIQVKKDAENMIVGIYNGKFAYITYEDYNKLNISEDTKEQTFIMTVVEEKDNNYNFIRTIEGRQ